MQAQTEFSGFPKESVDFLWNLRLNNNRAWFEEHKAEYRAQLLEPFRQFSRQLTDQVAKMDGERDFNVHISRIYKDMRYHRGEELYQDHMWMMPRVAQENWMEQPAFFFQFRPEAYEYGMGFWNASTGKMDALRARIDANPAEFEQIRLAAEKAGAFELKGELYKKKHTGKPPEIAAWYQRKDIYFLSSHPMDSVFFSPALLEQVLSDYRALLPVYRYLWSI